MIIGRIGDWSDKVIFIPDSSRSMEYHAICLRGYLCHPDESTAHVYDRAPLLAVTSVYSCHGLRDYCLVKDFHKAKR